MQTNSVQTVISETQMVYTQIHDKEIQGLRQCKKDSQITDKPTIAYNQQ